MENFSHSTGQSINNVGNHVQNNDTHTSFKNMGRTILLSALSMAATSTFIANYGVESITDGAKQFIQKIAPEDTIQARILQARDNLAPGTAKKLSI